MKRDTFIRKIRKKLLSYRLRPIRVFCFHQVSDVFEPETMWECDWMQTEVFKKKILALKDKYTFVSLEESYGYIANDKFRFINYAVLTADDGWASLKNIIPWLVEEKIPLTLFLNPLYMDGKHQQSRATEKFLTKEEVYEMTVKYEPYITIASHGWSHSRCSNMKKDEFEESILKAEAELSDILGKIPFFAFPFGAHSYSNILELRKKNLIPVLMDGLQNSKDSSCIHRELLEK